MEQCWSEVQQQAHGIEFRLFMKWEDGSSVWISSALTPLRVRNRMTAFCSMAILKVQTRFEFSGRVYGLSSIGSTIWIGACGMADRWLFGCHIEFSGAKTGQEREAWSQDLLGTCLSSISSSFLGPRRVSCRRGWINTFNRLSAILISASQDMSRALLELNGFIFEEIPRSSVLSGKWDWEVKWRKWQRSFDIDNRVL
jgi:hypothetical protein